MNDVVAPGFLSYAGADAIVAMCARSTRVQDPAGTLHILATHDFGQFNNHLELRVLGEFGFGGKLRVEHRSSGWRVYADAYPETERQPRVKLMLSHLNDDLASVAETLVFEPTVRCQSDHAGVWHALAPGADDDPDVTFRPVGCGGGIAFPAAPVTGVPTCVECRISAAVGVESWLWSHGVAELLCLLTSKKSFPPSRLPVAAMQLRMIGDVLAGPRAGIAQAIVDGHRIRWPHLPTPVGLVEMFDAYTRWNLGVLRAHGAEYAVRFPMKRQTLETIERGCRVLGVEVDR